MTVASPPTASAVGYRLTPLPGLQHAPTFCPLTRCLPEGLAPEFEDLLGTIHFSAGFSVTERRSMTAAAAFCFGFTVNV
jgi:hypothetical protein